MRAAARALVMMLVLTSAGSAFAGSKKATKNDFADLFNTKSAKASKSARSAPKKSAQKREARAPMLAEATPRPQPQQQQMLILSDYAPDRHAWVGP